MSATHKQDTLSDGTYVLAPDPHNDRLMVEARIVQTHNNGYIVVSDIGDIYGVADVVEMTAAISAVLDS